MKMVLLKINQVLGLVLVLFSTTAVGGVLDPDCNAKNAAKSTAMKATVGIGGRCSPKEAATDTAKDIVGINKKPLEKNLSGNKIVKKR